MTGVLLGGEAPVDGESGTGDEAGLVREQPGRRSGDFGGRVTFPLGALYHGSKFAVEGMSEALQYELTGIGARVKIVEPVGMNTDFGGRSLDFTNAPAATEYQRLVGSGAARSTPPSLTSSASHQSDDFIALG